MYTSSPSTRKKNCYLTSKDLIKTDDDHGQANGHSNKNIFPVPWNTGGLVPLRIMTIPNNPQ